MMINMISLPVNYETTGMVKESRSGRSDNKTHDKKHRYFMICPTYLSYSLKNTTLWLFNIAMENGPFIDGLPIKNI